MRSATSACDGIYRRTLSSLHNGITRARYGLASIWHHLLTVISGHARNASASLGGYAAQPEVGDITRAAAKMTTGGHPRITLDVQETSYSARTIRICSPELRSIGPGQTVST